MNTAFLDECFKARMDILQKRFPLEEFRRKFKEEYARRGMVMIRNKVVNLDLDGGMKLDPDYGFIFSSQHNLDIALRLLRLWGFRIIGRCDEYDHPGEAFAYYIQLPDEYLRRHLGSWQAGRVGTGLRSISNVNKEKRMENEQILSDL